MGLEHFHQGLTHNGYIVLVGDKKKNVVQCFSTLDICEIENAKKLWGEDVVSWAEGGLAAMPKWANELVAYITLSDEGRVKYIEDYLKTL